MFNFFFDENILTSSIKLQNENMMIEGKVWEFENLNENSQLKAQNLFDFLLHFNLKSEESLVTIINNIKFLYINNHYSFNNN